MSKPEPVIQNPQQALQEELNKQYDILSNKYKGPIRQVLSQSEEVILNTINQLVQNHVISQQQQKRSNDEIIRLRKLCDDNKIKHIISSPPLPTPNRKERRKAERKNAKNGKQ